MQLLAGFQLEALSVDWESLVGLVVVPIHPGLLPGSGFSTDTIVCKPRYAYALFVSQSGNPLKWVVSFWFWQQAHGFNDAGLQPAETLQETIAHSHRPLATT